MTERKRRVLVVGPNPPPYAGPEMAIQAILESPLRERFELRHLSTNVRKKNNAKGRVDCQSVVALLRFVWRLGQNLLSFRPHTVYYFVTATRLGWLARDVWCIAISRLLGANVVTHMRAGHFQSNLKNARSWEIKIIRWACHRVSWSLVQSPSLKSQFAGLAPDERIQVVPNMIDTKRYFALAPDDCQETHILFLGHLSQAKGYCDVLKIIPTVVERHPDVLFRFAGAKLDCERNVFHDQATGRRLDNESPDETFVKYVAGTCEQNYEYLGVLDENEKLEALKDCGLLVLPSYSEGFSMAVLEAITVGKPVVCTAVGAMRDYLRDGIHGHVIQPGDTEALATGILRLLDDRQYRDRVARGNSQFARENFSQSIVAKQLGDLWQSA